MVEIYTDGSCLKNPGMGGFAYLVRQDGVTTRQYAGYKEMTTNNEMELRAVIEALKWATANLPGQPLTVYTDSQYVVNIYNRWYDEWKRDNKLSSKKNIPTIEEMMGFRSPTIRMEWVKGHAGDAYNIAVDRLAKGIIETRRLEPGLVGPPVQDPRPAYDTPPIPPHEAFRRWG